MKASEVQDLRRRLGWSQSRLARSLRVTLQTVKSWEASRRSVSPAMELLMFMVEEKAEKGAGP